MYDKLYLSSPGGTPLEETHWSGGMYSPQFERIDKYAQPNNTPPPYGPEKIDLNDYEYEESEQNFPIYTKNYGPTIDLAKKMSSIKEYFNQDECSILRLFLIFLLFYLFVISFGDFLKNLSRKSVIIIIVVILFVLQFNF